MERKSFPNETESCLCAGAADGEKKNRLTGRRRRNRILPFGKTEVDFAGEHPLRDSRTMGDRRFTEREECLGIFWS